MTNTEKMKQITGATTVLVVADAAQSARYYEEKLGFATAFTHGEPVAFAIVERDDVSVHLFSVEGAGPHLSNRSLHPRVCDVYLFVTDVDALHQELVARGADVQGEPETWPYQMREFVVRDGDGYYLCFGQPVGEDE